MEWMVRGRRISQGDLEFIQELIKSHGQRGRSFISRELCEHWGWKDTKGALKDSACRHLLLGLQKRGLISLPQYRAGRRQGVCYKSFWALDLFTPLHLLEFPQEFPSAIEWRLANEGQEAAVYKELVNTYHYLGYAPEVGHFLRYIAYHQARPIACLGWAQAAWRVAVRDAFIGWTPTQRQKNLSRVVNNVRFLLLGRLPHLASHLLGRNIRRLALDWQKRYGEPPVLLETFVDTTRFQGTSYKAANWVELGYTKGRGKYDRYSQYGQTIKAVFVYPLAREFREILSYE